MNTVGQIAGIGLGIKLVNDRFRPKIGASAIVAVVCLGALFVMFCTLLCIGISNTNVDYIVMSSLGVFGIGYLLLISHVLQSPKNYYIVFQNWKMVNRDESHV